MALRRIAAFVALWIVVGAHPRAAETTAPQLAQSLQRKYDGIKDFSADFVHKYRGGVLKKEITETGRLLVKKPGKMRWEYKAPEPKLFVSDGVKMYSYVPQDKQVFVSSIPPGDQLGTPTMFLTGKGNLVRDFTTSRLARSGLLLLCLSLLATACASSAAMRRGRDAEIGRDYDRAVAEYTKAARLKPDDTAARTSLERAKLRAAEDHFQRGRRQ